MIVETSSDQEVLVDKAMAGEIEEAEEMIEKGNRIVEKAKVRDCIFGICFISSDGTLTIFNPYSKYYEYFVEHWLLALCHYSLVVVPSVIFLSWIGHQIRVWQTWISAHKVTLTYRSAIRGCRIRRLTKCCR